MSTNLNGGRLYGRERSGVMAIAVSSVPRVAVLKSTTSNRSRRILNWRSISKICNAFARPVMGRKPDSRTALRRSIQLAPRGAI